MEALEAAGMKKLYTDMEMPLLFTLSDMEKEGIRVNAEELKEYGEKAQVRIAELEKSIWQQAGEEFNINSPKQLGVILFEKLQMPGGKKTKTGYSTAADVLEKLAADYATVSDILEYRQLTKLKSTYADGLAGYIDESGRIHSTLTRRLLPQGVSMTQSPICRIFRCGQNWDGFLERYLFPKTGMCSWTQTTPRLNCVFLLICPGTKADTGLSGSPGYPQNDGFSGCSIRF